MEKKLLTGNFSCCCCCCSYNISKRTTEK